MGEISRNIVAAYGDESVRMVGDPPFYMLGGSVIEAESVPELERIFASVPGGARKLHWREMSRKMQREALGVLAGIARVDTVVIAAPLVGRKQERARRKCLEVLLPTSRAAQLLFTTTRTMMSTARSMLSEHSSIVE